MFKRGVAVLLLVVFPLLLSTIWWNRQLVVRVATVTDKNAVVLVGTLDQDEHEYHEHEYHEHEHHEHEHHNDDEKNNGVQQVQPQQQARTIPQTSVMHRPKPQQTQTTRPLVMRIRTGNNNKLSKVLPPITRPTRPNNKPKRPAKAISTTTKQAAASTASTNKTNKTKPKLLIHIGPIKTGSTTLQYASNRDRRLLARDGWLYPPGGPQFLAYSQAVSMPCKEAAQYSTAAPNATLPSQTNVPYRGAGDGDLDYYRQYLHQGNHSRPTLCHVFNPQKWKQVELVLQRFLQLYQSNNATTVKGLFWIDEMMGCMRDTPTRWNRLHRAFAPFDVTLVVSYRRYFEWFVSYYSQAFKASKMEEEIVNRWPTTSNSNARYDNRIKTLAEYHELLQRDDSSMLMRRWNMHHLEHHPARQQLERFRPHFPSIRVMNHHVDDLVAEFYGNVLGATETCRHMNATTTSVQKNEAVSHNYDMLAVAAMDAGLLNVTTLVPTAYGSASINPRHLVVEATRYHQEEVLHLTANDFYLVCLNATQLQTLYDASLRMEQDMMPQGLDDNRRQHLKAFQQYVADQRFCSIDAPTVLRQSIEWRQFFESLQIPPPFDKPLPPTTIEVRPLQYTHD